MVDRIDSPRTYSDIIDNYLLPNKPFILSLTATADWISIRKWVKNGTLDLTYLKNQFGRSRVPVADCGRCENSSQPKSDCILSDYLDYIETCSGVTSDSPSLYLKDWHFQREYPNYHAYSVPLYFTSDWLNEFAVATGDDDYRFVYIGVKGSWYVQPLDKPGYNCYLVDKMSSETTIQSAVTFLIRIPSEWGGWG